MKKIKTVYEFISKSSVYIPITVLISALIYKLLGLCSELFGSPWAFATLSAVIALVLPMMVLLRAVAPRKISLGSNSLSPSHLFVVLMASVFVCVAYVAFAVISDRYTLISFPVRYLSLPAGEAAGFLEIIFTALIPIICEELFFRGVIISEYLKYSSGVALIASTLLSALFALDLYSLPFYLILGLALGAMRIYTDSTLVTVVMRSIGATVLLLIRGRGFYTVINENAVIYAILALTLLFFCTLVTVMAMAKDMPSFTTYADGDYGKQEKRLAIFSPATIILIVLILLMR